MRIVFVNHNGGSIYHGPNLRTYYAARELARYGHEVSIVSSSYSHKYSVLPIVSGAVTRERIDGITYYWMRCVHYKNLALRVFSHLQFVFLMVRYRRRLPSRADIVVFSGPPPEVFMGAYVLSRRWQCPVVSDIRDLWPQTQIEMSSLQLANPYVWFLSLAQSFMVRKSRALISPLPGAHKYYRPKRTGKKVFVIENGCSARSVGNLPSNVLMSVVAGHSVVGGERQVSASDICRLGRFVVGYSGSFDRDNDIDTLMRAAEHLKDRLDLLFLFIGGGVRSEAVVSLAENARNVLVLDRVPSRMVPAVIDLMDVCYCGLRKKQIYQYGVSMAKCMEYMAAGRPILWLVKAYNMPVADGVSGYNIEPGDVEGVVAAVKKMSKMPSSELVYMGKNACSYFKANYDYKILGTQWEQMILRCAGRSGGR